MEKNLPFVVIYFKVEKNNKGKIKVWLYNNKLKENKHIYESGAINLGFGNWADDNLKFLLYFFPFLR